jgi:aspartyl-tRNA(Asn)/glutamyl-tRNA(Gln) amidotransferase subunit C
MPSSAPHPVDVPYLARLARLELTPGEIELFGSQISRILGHVEQLQGLDVSGIEPTAHAISVFDVVRGDGPEPGLSKEAALANAPRQANGLFLVPKVLD